MKYSVADLQKAFPNVREKDLEWYQKKTSFEEIDILEFFMLLNWAAGDAKNNKASADFWLDQYRLQAKKIVEFAGLPEGSGTDAAFKTLYEIIADWKVLAKERNENPRKVGI